MLNETDLFVTVNSTTAYHALARGIPVVTVNYLTRDWGVRRLPIRWCTRCSKSGGPATSHS